MVPVKVAIAATFKDADVHKQPRLHVAIATETLSSHIKLLLFICDVTERASIKPSCMEAKDTHCHELTITVSLTQLRQFTYDAYPNLWVTSWK